MTEITVNGVTYDLSTLDDNAKAQVASLQFLEVHMNTLRNEIAVLETARRTYQATLKAELEKIDTPAS